MIKRGGLTLKTGKIGRVNCLRQQMLMPGEQMDVDISGKVRLESLRERDNLRIHAQLDTFMQPLRWCQTAYVDYLTEGPDTANTIAGFSTTDLSRYGVGTAYTSTTNFNNAFRSSLLNIYNNWYRWPEDAYYAIWDEDGNKAVPLSKAWSRVRDSVVSSDSNDYTVSSVTNFTVQDLAEIQARFRSAQKLETFSFGRYMDIMNEVYDAKGSREVDKVPILVDSQEIGVNPRDLPATDGASQGHWQSIMDFNINNQLYGLVAPEQMIVSYMLTIRFAPITESIHPLVNTGLDWHTYTADPEYLSAAQPKAVAFDELFPNGSSSTMGYLPAGWQWRTDHDVIGTKIEAMDTFPMMKEPTSTIHCRDATRIKDCFRSNRLGDYLADIYFNETSEQPIGTAMDSYMSGMVGETKGKTQSQAEFPKQGKML
jgi:hypothetical protein